MDFRPVAVAIFFGAMIGAQPAHAVDAVCLDRDMVTARLADRHAERPRAAGLATNGEVLEIFASKDGSWTLVLTDPAGISCVIASGDAWTDLKPAVSAQDG